MAPSNTTMDWATWAFSPSPSTIIVSLLAVLLTPILVHYLLHRTSTPNVLPTILLVGPSGGGKTSLLTLFASGNPSQTQTSQQPQSAICQLPSSTSTASDRYRSEHDTSARDQPRFTLLDTPGHGKLRHHALSTLTTTSALKGLIFVLDSAAVSSASGLTEAAEYLHDILLLLQKRHTGLKTSKNGQQIPVLIAANKQDVFTSLPASLVKQRLEAEITKVRATRSKGLMDSGVGMEGDVGGGSEDAEWLGEYGSAVFGFEQMRECDVEVRVMGGNVRGDGGKAGKVEGWWEWIGEAL